MIKKLDKNAISDYILVMLLLVFSGNPIIRFFDKFVLMFLSVLILIVKRSQFKEDFFARSFLITSALLILFILQMITLNFVSWLGAFRYIVTFLFGGIIFYLVSDRLAFRFFIVLYYLSLISIVFFILINLLHVPIPSLTWGTYGEGGVNSGAKNSWIIYTYVKRVHAYRNCGMFWEPGAFAGILVLCLALNAMLWKNHKFKLSVIVIALLTTQSTAGYLVFFMIISYYFMFFVKSLIVKFTVIPTFLLAMAITYQNVDFLKEKIIEQRERTANLRRGEFANFRFSSFMLDLHYIKKHPLVGNGINEKTRYADDPLLMKKMQAGGSLGNANGFSSTLAAMGIPFLFFHLLFTFKTMSKVDGKTAFLVVFVMLLMLWGEQWIQYPIFTGTLFLKLKRYINENQLNFSFNS